MSEKIQAEVDLLMCGDDPDIVIDLFGQHEEIQELLFSLLSSPSGKNIGNLTFNQLTHLARCANAFNNAIEQQLTEDLERKQ